MAKWTKKRPTKPGFYWFDPDDTSPERLQRRANHVVHVEEDGGGMCCRWTGEFYRLEEMGGWFAGPLRMPKR
jgi:hypothetical protein